MPLITCPGCGFVAKGNVNCPQCDTQLRFQGGRIARTNRALMLGLSAAALQAAFGCSGTATVGTSGSGGSGGSGSGSGSGGAGGDGGSARMTSTITYYAVASTTMASCEEVCEMAYPAGIQDYNEIVGCLLCGACYDICDGPNMCTGGGEMGCSAQSSDCNACATSQCATGHDDNDVLVDPAAPCAKPYTACFGNSDCVEYAGCLSTCG